LILTGENRPAPTLKSTDAFEQSNWNFDDMVLWEDNDFILINKPPGLASQGGSGIKVSVDDLIRNISDRYKLVHRLDKDTSGVLAIAKKTTAAARFSELLKRKQMTKIYWALVKGVPEHRQGTINLPLAKKGARMEKVEVDYEEGKKAITEYSVMETLGMKMSWLELSPITGRTHQLRVHCAAMGCPIIGDGKYGGSEAFVQGVSNSLHLHARRLIVPELGIDVTAELPKHMKPIGPDA
jgi:23S rRNA pseudouridine955/2504/2580 synthase